MPGPHQTLGSQGQIHVTTFVGPGSGSQSSCCTKGGWGSQGSDWGHSRLRIGSVFSCSQQQNGTFCLDAIPGWTAPVYLLMTPSASPACSRWSISASYMNE